MSKKPARKKLIIAIDGTAGSGKSTLAKALAKRIGYRYVDTGAMYRYLTYKALRKNITDKKDLVNFARSIKIFHKGNSIRMPNVSDMVSKVAAVGGVRRQMVKNQRKLGKKGGIIMEGRDIGTVVFPKADLKLFLVAEVEERARRRYRELAEKGIKAKRKDVEENIVNRDIKDSSRSVSPLKPAKDAIIIDTTNLSMRRKNNLAFKYVKELLDNCAR